MNPRYELLLWVIGLCAFGVGVCIWLGRKTIYPVGHCRWCGYDLTGNVLNRCPECGHPMDQE